MKQITSEQHFNECLTGEPLLVAVFKADWCIDCRYIAPDMPEIEETFQGVAVFVEVDCEALPQIVEMYQVKGIPSFIAFKKGKEVVRLVNRQRKTKEEIKTFVSQAILVSNALENK